MNDSSIRLADVHKIAVLRANALGDFIFSLPALEALRGTYPQAEIVLLGLEWHARFLEGRPSPVDRVVVVPPLRGVSLPDWQEEDETDRLAVRELAAVLQKDGYDLAIQMHGGGRYSNPFVQRIGARVTAGLKSPKAEPLDRWIPYYYWQPEVLRLLEVASLVGASPRELSPRLSVTAADLAESRQVYPGGEHPFAVLHPGAGDGRRRWSLQKFAALGDDLARAGMEVVLCGSDADRPLAVEMVEMMDYPACNLTGRLSLGGLTGLLERAHLMVGNDSGPLHLAEAVGTATVGIYWFGNLINAEPMTRLRHRPVISWRVECPICGRNTISDNCEHHASFVEDASLEEARAAALDLLAGQPLTA